MSVPIVWVTLGEIIWMEVEKAIWNWVVIREVSLVKVIKEMGTDTRKH